jgi:hypothetical protein
MKITNFTNVIALKDIGNYLFKTRCKCENKFRGAQKSLQVTSEYTRKARKWT